MRFAFELEIIINLEEGIFLILVTIEMSCAMSSTEPKYGASDSKTIFCKSIEYKSDYILIQKKNISRVARCIAA